MKCHKRVTHFVIIVFNFLSLIGIAVEVGTPWLLKETNYCQGFVTSCNPCPNQLWDISDCTFNWTIKGAKTTSLAAVGTAFSATAVIVLLSVLSVFLGCCFCCSKSTWPTFYSRYLRFHIVATVITLGSNIAALVLCTQIVANPTKESFYPAFWVGWVTNGILVVLLLIIIFFLHSGNNTPLKTLDDRTTVGGFDFSLLYRNLSKTTPSTVFGSKREQRNA